MVTVPGPPYPVPFPVPFSVLYPVPFPVQYPAPYYSGSNLSAAELMQ
jgi:hypothetical protein